MIAAEENPHNPAPLDNKIIFNDDSIFNQVQVIDFEPFRPRVKTFRQRGRERFLRDGSQVIVLLKSEGLLDQYAVQVADR